MTETSSKWRKRVARWRASGETAEAFSAREGFAASTLRWWSSKLRSTSPAAKAVPMMQLVRVASTTTTATAAPPGGGLVIDVVGARARITVAVGVDGATLRTVLAALGVGGAA